MMRDAAVPDALETSDGDVIAQVRGVGTVAERIAVTDDGVRLRYRIDGPDDAPPLLLINSLGTNLAMWEPQLPAFVERFRVVRYDARGHGGSDVPPGPYPIARLGADALVVLDAAGVARAAVCGLSLGGMTAMWLGSHAPERVSHLVLANTAAVLGPRDVWDARIAAVADGGMAAVVDGVLDRWFTRGFRSDEPQAVERVRAMLETTSPFGYAAACAGIRDMDQRADLARVRAPVLVIVGTHDPATPPALGDEIAAAVPCKTLVALESAHLSNVERPDAFTHHALAFLCGTERT